jgi:general secretion pathway protein D
MSSRKYTFGLVTIAAAMVLLVFGSCTVRSTLMRRGLEIYRAGNYDGAVKYFQDMVQKHPENMEFRTFLFRAQLNSYYQHLASARKLKATDKRDEAMKEYKIALAIFPDNKRLEEEFNDFMGIGREESRGLFRSTIVPPVSLAVKTSEKISLKLRSVPITKIFNMLGKSYKVNFIFDKDFRDFVYTIEIDNIGFYDILNQLCMVSNAKYRVMDSASILIFPNTTFKNRTFALRGIKVFYLSNVKAEDAKKLVMTVFREEQIMVQEDKGLNALIVKAGDDTLKGIEEFIYKIDKRKGEVEINIEIIEVNRNLLSKIGATFGSTLFSLSAGSGGADTQVNATVKMDELDDIGFYITLPSAALNFLATDDNSRIISKPNLRGVNDEEIKFMVGDEVPIPQTQFQSIAAGGINNTPVTTYQYKNVGVEIKVTPFIHANNEITLKTKMTINFIAGYVGDFPTFGKREIENIIRLKEGETNIVGGFIKDEGRDKLDGLPVVAKIPILGKLFGSSQKTITQTDLIFAITPRIIRTMEMKPFDVATIWTNSEQGDHGSQPIVAPSEGDERERRRESKATVSISPSRRRVAAGRDSIFSIRLSSSEPLSTISIGGSISGGKAAIEEAKTDFMSKDKVRVLQNVSADSFDLGYSFTDASGTSAVLAQLKIKFFEKGEYKININNVSGYTKDRKQVELNTSSAEVEVF